MKILQTNFHTKWGGQAAVVLNLSRALAARGHSVTIATPLGSILAERATAVGLNVFSEARFNTRWRLFASFSDGSRLRRLIRSEGFDIVHSNGSPDGWGLTAAIRGMNPRPIVLRTRHNFKRIRLHYLNRWFYGQASDHVVAVSTGIKEHCLNSGLCSEDKVTVIHPALDTTAFRAGVIPRMRLREELGLSDDSLVIGTNARLEVQKGIDFLLETFRDVQAQEPRAELVIAGHGKQRLILEAQARELGIADKVKFCGFRSDIPVVLAGLDLFVLPSRTEGFGVALVEAMAMKLPVIGTRVGGITDILAGETCGVLVEHGDVKGFADAIVKLLQDPETRSRLGLAAQKRAQAFSPGFTAECHETLYERLLAQRKH